VLTRQALPLLEHSNLSDIRRGAYTLWQATSTPEVIIIATGSEAVVPPIPGVREGLAAGTVLTNREILNLTEIPESLVVVGGGVIGLEMASYYQTVGSAVTVIEMLDHIAGNADRELTAILQKNFEKKGIVFHLNAQVTAVATAWSPSAKTAPP